jgi:hypothetical protein
VRIRLETLLGISISGSSINTQSLQNNKNRWALFGLCPERDYPDLLFKNKYAGR